MDLRIKYGALTVDGSILRSENACMLGPALTEGRQLILDAIADIFSNNNSPNPQPPRIWVMYLGPREEVLSLHGKTKTKQGVYEGASHLKPLYFPHWLTAVRSALQPEARQGSSFLGAPSGVYLLVRKAATY